VPTPTCVRTEVPSLGSAETCRSYHLTWIVFYDFCIIVFDLVNFVGVYVECIKDAWYE